MTAAPLKAHDLKEKWLNRALVSAEIDRERWRPSKGVDENRRTIEAVYRYYGRLFLDHPHLEWAGMANMIGPAFYAGFRDLGWIPDHVRAAVLMVLGRASRRLLAAAGGDLYFYETTFLTMQKQIFEDQAPMHEAYLGGGISEIQKFLEARIIDSATLEAWRRIDAGRRFGDTAAVDEGNRTLLFREQRDIIDRFYIRMLDHRSPEGSVFTYLLTLAGAPSIPGGRSYPEEYPLVLRAAVPRIAVSLRTPLADGNIAIFANRWQLIEDDTLPDYLSLLREHPDLARNLVETPIADRVADYRLIARAGSLAKAAITRWDLDVGLAAPGRWTMRARPAKPVLAAETGAATFDLTSPPTRESAALAGGSRSRVWMNPDRETVASTVLLPNARSFRVRAAMAVMTSTTGRSDPERLLVQLPPMGIEEGERLLLAYAAAWGFPADAVTEWRDRADRRESTDRDYSTHVFTADAVGFVKLEFQASHYVRAGYAILSALLSWHADGRADH